MLEILISSSVLIAVLAILRLALRGRISARLQYALWLLVLVRLLVPVSFFHSPVSAAQAAAPVAEVIERSEVPVGPVSVVSALVLLELGVVPARFEQSTTILDIPFVRFVWPMQEAAVFLWRAGMIVMAVWFLYINIRMARRLKKSRTPYRCDSILPVYAAEGIPSPCLFGLFRPAVYLTPHAAEDEAQARQIIAHELTHYRHGDMIWALMRSVCLVVWWFNPFVWLAAALSRQDCELACDEGTIKSLGEGARFDYGRTLVGMAKVGARPSELLCGATTMTTGRRSLKERVARIANARKMSVTAAAVVLLLAAAAVGFTYAGPADSGAEPTAEAVQIPQSAELRIIDTNSLAERSVTITGAEDVRSLFQIYETGRAQATDDLRVLNRMYETKGIYSAAPGENSSLTYSVRFVFPASGPEPENSPASVSFEMRSDGWFLFSDVTDPGNGDALIWYDGKVAEYKEMFESLYEKYSAVLPSADVLSGIGSDEASVEDLYAAQMAGRAELIQAVLALLGDYGPAGLETELAAGSMDRTADSDLIGRTEVSCAWVLKIYDLRGGDYPGYESAELHYARWWADETHAKDITAEMWEALCGEYQTDGYLSRYRASYRGDLTVNGQAAAVVESNIEKFVVWYDAQRGVIFTLTAHEESPYDQNDPPIEPLMTLAESVG